MPRFAYPEAIGNFPMAREKPVEETGAQESNSERGEILFLPREPL